VRLNPAQVLFLDRLAARLASVPPAGR
jgi:hypothetical protein